jgi:predicted kinase
MELVVFIGIQATGKSSFYLDRFFRTHVRVNLDMLKTRNREQILVRACIEGKTKFVSDNTNLTEDDRARFIAPARAAGYLVHGYYFQSRAADALLRNGSRAEQDRVPDLAIRSAMRCLKTPKLAEGFDKLFFVRFGPAQGFVVDDWKDEI